jgi:hypothetical protein
MVNDLDKCGDKYCGNIITSKQLKKEGTTFFKMLLKNVVFYQKKFKKQKK